MDTSKLEVRLLVLEVLLERIAGALEAQKTKKLYGAWSPATPSMRATWIVNPDGMVCTASDPREIAAMIVAMAWTDNKNISVREIGHDGLPAETAVQA